MRDSFSRVPLAQALEWAKQPILARKRLASTMLKYQLASFFGLLRRLLGKGWERDNHSGCPPQLLRLAASLAPSQFSLTSKKPLDHPSKFPNFATNWHGFGCL
jgi:hypothetical protein